MVSSGGVGSGHCVTFDQSPALYADKNAAQASAPRADALSGFEMFEKSESDNDSMLGCESLEVL